MLDNTTSVLLLVVIAALYMLPSLIAAARDHPQRRQLTILNLLFGWTLIVWIAVFVWALAVPTDAATASRP